MNWEGPFGGAVESIALALLAVALLLAVVRLVRGPTLPDRVIALDLITILGLGILAVYAMATDRATYLDVGIVVALVTFLSTIAFAYYIEKSAVEEGE